MLSMQIRVGFQMLYEFAARTPVVLMLNVHPSRATDMIEPDQLRITPALPVTRYLDAFGNLCSRLVAPAGGLTISTDALIVDFGAWFAVYLGGRWYAVDARHNVPRIGRIVMARGRDAADVAFSTTFGANVLKRFAVHTDEAAPSRIEAVERLVA